MVPGADFPGVAPGQSVEIEYLTPLITNISFAPAGPYVVFDEAPDRGHAIDYVAVPFERPARPGRDPARRDAAGAVRARPGRARHPRWTPCPRSSRRRCRSEKREGQLRLEAMPAVSAPPELQAEAAFAAEYLRPHVAKAAGKAAAPSVRLETGPVEGQASPEAYELVVDPVEGIRIAAPRPPASSTACSRCGACCPRPRLRRAGVTLPRYDDRGRPALRLPRASCSTSRATSSPRPRCCARST